MGDVDQARTAAAAMMPTIKEALDQMVAVPSVAFPGYPPEPVHQMADTVLGLFQEVGFTNAALMEVPDGYPPIYGEIEGPAGSPVVMLYAHYDVQPAPPEQGWTSDPWTPTHKDDGRIYGRGAADDKGGLAIHLGTLRSSTDSRPCTVKLILEGMEETASNLEAFVEAHPELFACDLFVVCDMGNLEAGEPALTTTLRGDVACVVTVQDPRAPPALRRVRRPRARRDDGARAAARDPARRPGQRRGRGRDARSTGTAWTSARRTSEPAPTCSTASSWSGAARWDRACGPTRRSTRSAIDMTSIAGSSNVLIPGAKAKISMRIVPGSDPEKELDALVRHLETHAPWGAQVEVERTKEAPPFRCETDGPGYAAARVALEEAYGSAPGEAGSGGSIPLLRTLQQAAPDAEFILWGPEDVALSRIHASDESVDPAEIEKMIVAQIRLLEHLADKD